MKIIISFTGLKSSRDSVPYALQWLAGSTVLGHILANFLDLPVKQLILIVDGDREQVENRVRQYLPDFPLQVIQVEEAADPVSALFECRSELDSESLLFVSGNYIAEAAYLELISSASGASCLVQAEQNPVPGEKLGLDNSGFFTAAEGARQASWAGTCWFRHGVDLAKALDAVDRCGNHGLERLLSQLAAQGVQISAKLAATCLDTQSTEGLLHANRVLLRLDHGSQDAIERSYAEDFTVLPPVFLHETAVIENSVVGPYVNLEAQAKVQNSVIRNSLVGTGSQITDAVITDSLIGDDVVIMGFKSVVLADDGTVVNLGKENDRQ